MATDAERLLAEVRELVRREVHPARQQLGALGIDNIFREGRLTSMEWMEAWILIDRLLGANALLIELLGIDWYVGGQKEALSSSRKEVNHDEFQTNDRRAGSRSSRRASVCRRYP
ncbi:MAG: hypothetical protein L0338_11690 [Acidobacteria bacterium]|nr:hypothetical protein [Acidobacteriota bacterium]